MIFQIDVDCVCFQPTECDPPVTARIDCVTAFVAADERVKTEVKRYLTMPCRRQFTDLRIGPVTPSQSKFLRCLRASVRHDS